MSTLAVLIAVVIFATLATAYASAVRSSSLRRKFESLGKVKGRSLEEVLRFVGKPSTHIKPHAGRDILEWRRINFHAQLTFTGGICDSIDYEG